MVRDRSIPYSTMEMDQAPLLGCRGVGFSRKERADVGSESPPTKRFAEAAKAAKASSRRAGILEPLAICLICLKP